MDDRPAPDDLPRSPTGRVPDWVVREARGEQAEVLPFRAPPDGPRRRRRRTARQKQARKQREPRSGARVWVPSVLVVAVLAAVYGYLSWNPLQVTFPWTTASSGEVPASALPPSGIEEGPRPPGLPPTPPVPPESSTYGWIATQDDGVTPVLYSPCRPIHWVVRPDNMPIGGLKLLTDAIAEVSRLTGIAFVYDGVTDEPPSEHRPAYQPDRYPDRWAPVLVAWATPEEVPDFGDDVLATGGSVGYRTPSGDEAFVTGEVRLDSVEMDDAIIHKRLDLVHAVLLHEFGHVMGLDHVSDSQQLMYPEAQLTLTELGTGDIDGFGFAGQGACQPDI